MKISTTVAIVAPSFGPSIVTLFGLDIPVLALGMSCCGLLLARVIAPAPLRKLTPLQEACLTALLMLVLTLIVTGKLGTGSPLGEGMASMWGIGLGFSGLLAIELIGERITRALGVMFGTNNTPTDDEPQP